LVAVLLWSLFVLDSLVVLHLPSLPPRGWLEAFEVYESWILVSKGGIGPALLLLVCLDKCRKTGQVLDQRALSNIGVSEELEGVTWRLAGNQSACHHTVTGNGACACTQSGRLSASGAKLDLVEGQRHDLLRKHIEGQEVEVLEEKSVLCCQVVLLKIVDEDLLLLGMLVEVLSEPLVREELPLELVGLLHLDRPVVEAPCHVLDSRLDLNELLPEDGHALDHVGDTESLLHLPLAQGEGLSLFSIRWSDECEHCTVVLVDSRPLLLIAVVLSRCIKVDDIRHRLHFRLGSIACL